MREDIDPLDCLLSFFPSGTAEGEREILEKVFIYADEFKEVISPTPGNPIILVGEKGSGKSALVDFSSRLTISQDIPTVTLTPFDIDTSALSALASTGDMVRSLYDIVLISIAKKLSEENTGWFQSDYAALYHAAVDSGARNSDLPGKVGKFIAEAAKGVSKVDLVSAFPHLTTTTREEVERSAQRIVGKRSFYLFIDDTDQISNPDEAAHLNRVWAIILAARRLAEKIPELKCIVTLRSEVWNRLQRDVSGQRDQADHFKTLVVKMFGSRDHVKRIMNRRLLLASAKIGSVNDVYEEFFDGAGAHAPNSKSFRSWEDLIAVRSRERPRDAIQLVNKLAKHAQYNKKTKIDQGTFSEVMPPFSKSISDQFAQEVILECPNALDILKTLASADYDHPGFTMSANRALEHFKKVPSRFSLILFGKNIHQGNETEAFELWQFFYTSRVINARASDAIAKDGFKHLDPNVDPFLVSKARWNDLQKLLWEVDASYRDYLIQLQAEQASQTGLPVKNKRRRQIKGRRSR